MKLKNTALLIGCLSFGALWAASSAVFAADFDEYNTPLCGPGKCGNKGTNTVPINNNSNTTSSVGKVIPFSQVSQNSNAQRQNKVTNGRKNKSSGAPTINPSKDDFSHSFYYRSFSDSVDFTADGKSYTPNVQDGLWRIATNTRVKGVSVHQQIAALYRKNLGCFINGNVDDRDKKCSLKMPTYEQAIAENDSDGIMLLTYHGTTASDYNYALKNCKFGVCSLKPKSDQPTEQASKTEIKQPLPDSQKQEQQVKAQTEDIKGSSSSGSEPSINIQLVDNNGTIVPTQSIIPNAKADGTVENKNVSDSKQANNVSAINQNVLDEYNRDLHNELDRVYGKKISESQEDIKTLSANQVAMVNEYKEEIQKLNEKIDKLNEIIQEKESLVPMIGTTEQIAPEEDSNFKMWIIIIACIFFVLSFVGYFFVTKTKKIENEDMDEATDDLDSDDHGLGSLMTTQYQIPGGVDGNVASDSDASSEINLNDDETAQSSQTKTDSYVINESSDDLVPADFSSGVGLDTSKNQPSQPQVSLDEWDEQSFAQENSISESNEGMSFDLESDNSDSQIDSIISQSELSKPTVEDLLNSFDTGNEDKSGELKSGSDNDLDSLLTSKQQSAKVSNDDDIDALLSVAQPEEKVSNNDDIDALLSAAQPEEKVSNNDDIDALLSVAQPEEKVSNNDDIDALLSAAQPEEKVSNNDDIDALLSAAQPDEKVSNNDDIDALLSAAQPDEKVSNNDDIDALLSASQQGETSTTLNETSKVKSNDSIDDILSSVQSSPKVSHDEDIDDILSSVQSSSSATNDDELDALLASSQAKKQSTAAQSGKKVSDEIDDIDSILDMVKDPEGDKKHEEQMKMLEVEAQQQMNVYEPDREEEQIPEADQEQFTLVDVYIKSLADIESARGILEELVVSENPATVRKAKEILETLKN